MKCFRCVVCGMWVNEKNFSINAHSFMEANSDENISSCPFCGVGRNYLSAEDKLYEVDMKLLSAEIIKILDSAMKLEVFNGEFYQEASRMAKSEGVKRMFKDLSSIEFMHAKVHMRLGGFESLPKLHKPDYSKHDTDELLLVEACKREKHAVHFYERNFAKLDNEMLKAVLNALSEVEKQHIQIVS